MRRKYRNTSIVPKIRPHPIIADNQAIKEVGNHGSVNPHIFPSQFQWLSSHRQSVHALYPCC